MIPAAPLPPPDEVLQSLATALGLGLLVGLQREWARSKVAGIRTFALLTLFGAICGLIGLAYGGWVIAAAFLAFASMVILGNLSEKKVQQDDAGLTTEMAMLVMYSAGIITMLGHRLEAVVVSGSVMVLLHSKKRLHDMVGRIGEDDLREIARLVLAALVILPLLPNREMGYLNVLNPFSIWLMVVLIVGVSLAAYLAGKFLGGNKAPLLAGVLGGLISSTATTASLARRSHAKQADGISLAAVCTIASAIVFLRVMAEVMIAAPSHWRQMMPPLLVVMFWFGLLYAVVLIVVATARQHFGGAGLYIAAAISGLTDMDAITLSTSRLVSTGHLGVSTGWRMILVGGMANVGFKMGIVAVLGARAFIRPALLAMTSALAGGIAILLLWP